MKYLHIPFSFIYKVWFGIVFFGSMLLLYPIFKFFLIKKQYEEVFYWEKRWAKILCFFTFIRVKRTLEAPLPPPPYIICANHSSYIDTITMFFVTDDFFVFMGKQELLNWPLFRIFFYDMNITVNRRNPAQALKALEKAKDYIDKGICIAIFPEGGIPPSAPKPGKFKKGAFLLAIEKQIPIVPVTFTKNFRIFGEPLHLKSRARPGTSHLIVHKPIDTCGLKSADLIPLSQETNKIISSTLDKNAGKR